MTAAPVIVSLYFRAIGGLIYERHVNRQLIEVMAKSKSTTAVNTLTVTHKHNQLELASRQN